MKHLSIHPTSDTNAPHARIRLAAFGALYGCLLGTVFVFAAAYIDLWLHPELPLGVNWDLLMRRLPLIVIGLTLTGAIACWWNETWQGLLSGSLFLAALALFVALTTSPITAEAKFVVLLFILMPIAVMSAPIIWSLRRLAESHAVALRLRWGFLRIIGLLILATALGTGAGYFMKMPADAIESTQLLHGLLQDLARENNPVNKAQGASEHASTPYKLYTTQSTTSTEGFDIRVEYEDGFTLNCIVVAYPGYKPYLSDCQPGK